MSRQSKTNRPRLQRGVTVFTRNWMVGPKFLLLCFVAGSIVSVSSSEAESYSKTTLQHHAFENEALLLSATLRATEVENSDYHPIAFLSVGGTGDFDSSGCVDVVDIDTLCANLGQMVSSNPPVLAPMDLFPSGSPDGVIDLQDLEALITQHVDVPVTTTNPTGKGTCLGDLNLDGQVSVLADAFALVSNLGSAVTSYDQGDINCNGVVDILGPPFMIGDAPILIGNLGNVSGAACTRGF